MRLASLLYGQWKIPPAKQEWSSKVKCQESQNKLYLLNNSQKFGSLEELIIEAKTEILLFGHLYSKILSHTGNRSICTFNIKAKLAVSANTAEEDTMYMKQRKDTNTIKKTVYQRYTQKPVLFRIAKYTLICL